MRVLAVFSNALLATGVLGAVLHRDTPSSNISLAHVPAKPTGTSSMVIGHPVSSWPGPIVSHGGEAKATISSSPTHTHNKRDEKRENTLHSISRLPVRPTHRPGPPHNPISRHPIRPSGPVSIVNIDPPISLPAPLCCFNEQKGEYECPCNVPQMQPIAAAQPAATTPSLCCFRPDKGEYECPCSGVPQTRLA